MHTHTHAEPHTYTRTYKHIHTHVHTHARPLAHTANFSLLVINNTILPYIIIIVCIADITSDFKMFIYIYRTTIPP